MESVLATVRRNKRATTYTDSAPSVTPGPYPASYQAILSRTLSSWQMYGMLFNLVFGVGYFQNTTYALQTTGGIGAMMAWLFVGVVALCVVDCISEMVTVFPISNSMAQFVRVFVDEDLAILISIGYWLSYVAIFNTLVCSATNLLRAFTGDHSYVPGLSMIWCFLLLVINILPVRTYGHVQFVLGCIKMIFFISVAAFAIYEAASQVVGPSEAVWNSFWGSNDASRENNALAFVKSLSLPVFSFMGIESVTMTAAESHSTAGVASLMGSTTILAVFVCALLALFGSIAPGRMDEFLSTYTSQGYGGLVPLPRNTTTNAQNVTAVLAMLRQHPRAWRTGDVILIFSALTAANTALYVGSRSLFGSVQEYRSCQGMKWLFGPISQVATRSRVPVAALCLTLASGVWMSLINVTLSPKSSFEVLQLTTNMAVSTCLMIWASQCIVLIRFHKFRGRFGKQIDLGQIKLTRHVRKGPFAYLQPFTALIGLAGCVLLLAFFSTAFFWGKDLVDRDVRWTLCGLYSSPVITAYCYVLLKLRRWIPQRRIGPLYVDFKEWDDFKKAIKGLQSQIHPMDFRAEEDDMRSAETGDVRHNLSVIEQNTAKLVQSSEKSSITRTPAEFRKPSQRQSLNIDRTEPIVIRQRDLTLCSDIHPAFRPLHETSMEIKHK